MTVKELIEQLQLHDQDKEILLQVDEEGNGYNKLECIDGDVIRTEYNEVYSTDWSADDVCMDEDEWREFKEKNKSCVVLAP